MLLNSEQYDVVVYFSFGRELKELLQERRYTVVGFSPSGREIHLLPMREDKKIWYWEVRPESTILFMSEDKDVFIKYESFLEETPCERP